MDIKKEIIMKMYYWNLLYKINKMLVDCFIQDLKKDSINYQTKML